ncbi:MAG: hypothetical protein PHQ26_09730 [Bacteroidales bacterium]|jgi:Ser-tRNA(Ala) deacylase AlaX|nr:hypothetical protein [Bacteroidales bacterium]MDD3167533.1 hypothetical protein [Bacteroidales bacterium]MDD4771741.1 hypothetical protein [Bacteroidales bacterium]
MNDLIISHNKAEYPPMHTAEHVLNQTMHRFFACGRSFNAHIERKKSKCDYHLSTEPTPEQLEAVEAAVNAQIARNLEVRIAFVERSEIPAEVDLSKLPDYVDDRVRLVYVGDYDICACIGDHVRNTSEIGTFKIISSDYADGRLRLRFKLLE